MSSPSIANPLPHILAVNGGSSSIKFALFEVDENPRRIGGGAIDRIGSPEAKLTVKTTNEAAVTRHITAPNQTAAVAALVKWIQGHIGHDALSAVGHRVVHGGPKYSLPELVTDEMVGELHRLETFDPEHLPGELLLLEEFERHFPSLPQVACFDTAFHHDMPRVARLLPIPRRYESQGIRRYGFHGLSYEYLMTQLARIGDVSATTGRVILAHLGNGASMAAVRDGKSIDTSMGFTPAGGLVMGTRTGDLDPGILFYLAQTEGRTAAELQRMVNHESGTLGISGTASDIRDLLALEATDPCAAEAVGLFCYEAKKRIGAYAAALGGLDTLVFSGGIGQNSPLIRHRICDGLGFLGIEINDERNAQNALLISPDTGRVKVRVIRTDEELTIARSVARLLGLGATQGI